MTVDELIDRLTELPGWMDVQDNNGSTVSGVVEHWGTVRVEVTP